MYIEMKKILSTIAITLAIAAAISCNKESEPSYTPKATSEIPDLQGIEVTPKTNYLVIGDKLQLSVNLSPETAIPVATTWVSDSTEVATVDSEGNVTGVATGIARITATVDGKSSTAIVNVLGERVPATGLTLSKDEVNILAGRSTKVKAVVTPENTTDHIDVQWSSADSTIATVSYGVIIGVRQGTTTVTASMGDLKATCNVIVGDKLKLVDRTPDWPIVSSSYWQKNWRGVSAKYAATLEECDNELHYFEVRDYTETAPDIEAIADDLDAQVAEILDSDGDPSSLFSKDVPQKVDLSDKGEKWGIVLGYDAEYNFTGEYALYKFTVDDPDPVHATGIIFNEGDLSEITLKVGKSKTLNAKAQPDDCTDELNYTWASADESIATVSLPWGSNYSYYAKITGVSAGTTTVTVTLGEITKEITVTVEGSSVEFKNVTKTAGWTYTYGVEEKWGSSMPYFQLETCSAAQHVIAMNTEDGWSYYVSDYTNVNSVFSYVEEQLESSWSSISITSDLPDKQTCWGDGNIIVYVFAYDESGNFTGEYAYYEIDPNSQPVNIVSLDGQYFPVEWNSGDDELDNVTMSAWVNSSSFSGGKDNIYTIMGTEGIFLLRFEGSNLYLVYGGAKRDNGEYMRRRFPEAHSRPTSGSMWRQPIPVAETLSFM